MSLLRLLGLGAIYGFGFMVVKSIFPEPFALLLFQGEQSSGENLTVVSLTYILSGLAAGVISAPLLSALLRLKRGPAASFSSVFPQLTLSLALAVLMGVISALIILASYSYGLLQTGGALDPLSLIESSNFAPGTPILVAWTIARELLPAGLAGLLLAPVGGTRLLRLYNTGRQPAQKPYDHWDEELG